MKTRSMYKAERVSLDRISTLPELVLETILSLLSTREAARTSILSREWRYKWTTIPKLELSHSMHCGPDSDSDSGTASTKRNLNMRCKSCYDIYQTLLLRQGPIHEFTLDMPNHEFLELDRIMLHLSKNHPVKKLTLIGTDIDEAWCKLPISLSSFHHLTDLSVRYIDLDDPPIFSGFGSLGNLYLRHVGISAKTLLNLLSNCPSLKILSLLIADQRDKCTVNQLFKCIPSVVCLTSFALVSRLLVLDSVSEELSTSLVHLKYFCFQEVNTSDGYVLPFLLHLIKCSPNLRKIKIKCDDHDYHYDEEVSLVWEKYTDVWLEHLNELEIVGFDNSKHEMEFVKFILARSPKLKKVKIRSIVEWNQQPKMLKTLLQAPRVSPVVITVR